MLGPEDQAVLDGVAPELFDHEIHSRWAREFLRDPRHHLVVALDGATVVGFVSGVHYVHPDKPPELWINEVGVAPSHQRRGIGQQVLQAMLRHGRGLGCREAWVLTSPDNAAAIRLYQSLGGLAPDEATVMYNFLLDPAPR
jgi:ribosomal protein S18 acetylase RimI-like enzyme